MSRLNEPREVTLAREASTGQAERGRAERRPAQGSASCQRPTASAVPGGRGQGQVEPLQVPVMHVSPRQQGWPESPQG